jgi:hypothetical protein
LQSDVHQPPPQDLLWRLSLFAVEEAAPYKGDAEGLRHRVHRNDGSVCSQIHRGPVSRANDLGEVVADGGVPGRVHRGACGQLHVS